MKKVLMWAAGLVVALMVLGAIVGENGGAGKKFTGKLRIDASTEYVALDTPSPIGGSCDGWNALSIQKPGQPETGLINVVCWKRIGEDIVMTDRSGAKKTSGPAQLWYD